MKKFKSKLAVILAITLVLTSFELAGVFAEGEGNDQAETVVTEQAAGQEEAVEEEPQAEEETSEASEAAEEAIEESGTVEIKDTTYSINYYAADGGTVTNDSDTTEITGSTAVPNTGYSFEGWYFDEETEACSTEAELSAAVITGKLGESTSGTFTAKFTENAPAIEDLKTLSSCKRVYLRWHNDAPVEKVNYTITVYNKTTKKTVKTVTVAGSDLKVVSGYYQYIATGLDYMINYKTGKYPNYKFTITAKSEAGTDTKEATDAPVRTIAYKIKIKTSGTLKSHAGKKATVKVKAGQTIYAYGFGCGGKYLFKNANGSLFYCNFTRTSSRSCVYAKSANYTDEEATLFVNDAGFTSKKNSMVWVNTYTQHIYLFKGKKGSWKLNGVSAECATGKASSPSPTSAANWGRQHVWKKISSRHGIPYWSCYSDINAIHAKRSSWSMGKPASNGCVRNLKKNAKKIYENAKINTYVYLY